MRRPGEPIESVHHSILPYGQREMAKNRREPVESVREFGPLGSRDLGGRVGAWLSLAVLLGLPTGAWLGALVVDPLEPAFPASSQSGDTGDAKIMVPPWILSEWVARIRHPATQTLKVAVGAAVAAVPLGAFLGFVLARTDTIGRSLSLWLLGVLALTPLPVTATAWIGALGNVGRAQWLEWPGGDGPWLVGWIGAAWVHAIAALPWTTLIAALGWRRVEPELEEAARLETGRLGVILGVSARRARGFLIAATVAVILPTVGEMTITDLLQVRTFAEEAYLQFGVGRGARVAALLALPPLLVALSALVWADRAIGATTRRHGAAREARRGRALLWRWPQRWQRAAAGLGLGLVLAILVIIPWGGLIWRAGRVGGDAAAGLPPRWSLAGLLGTLQRAAPEVIESLVETVPIAASGATLAVLLALAWTWLGRSRSWARWVGGGMAALALAMPGPVAGMALVLAWGRGPLAQMVPWVYDSPLVLVFAHTFRTFPFAWLILRPALAALPRERLEAAALGGLGPQAVFGRVVLPALRPALAASWMIAFTLALGELPASHWVEPPGTTLLSKRLWSLLHTGVESHLAGFALICQGLFVATGTVALALALRLAHEPGLRRGDA
jgi:iron(III) transport system permease protein